MSDQRLRPHRIKKRFYNHHLERIRNRLFHEVHFVIKAMGRRLICGRKQFFPRHISLEEWQVKTVFKDRSIQPLITWIGHATFLIQMNGINIITDPVYGEISRFFKRHVLPTTTIEELPAIDLIMISHNHRDHCDTPTLKKLQQLHDPMLFVPRGDGAYGKWLGFSRVTEMDWWEERLVDTKNGFVRISFLPAAHWSARGLFDINHSLWGSWLMRANTTSIYFAGDTAYSSHFSEIGSHCDPIDVALMPIGPSSPSHHMKRSHVSAAEAVQGFLEMEARFFIPMHWGTFHGGYDNFDDSLLLLQQVWGEQQNQLKEATLYCMKFGEQWLYPH